MTCTTCSISFRCGWIRITADIRITRAIFALIQPIVPIAAEAFADYNFQSIHLSRLEVEAIKSGKPLASENKRETAEWEEKKKQLGL